MNNNTVYNINTVNDMWFNYICSFALNYNELYKAKCADLCLHHIGIIYTEPLDLSSISFYYIYEKDERKNKILLTLHNDIITDEDKRILLKNKDSIVYTRRLLNPNNMYSKELAYKSNLICKIIPVNVLVKVPASFLKDIKFNLEVKGLNIFY